MPVRARASLQTLQKNRIRSSMSSSSQATPTKRTWRSPIKFSKLTPKKKAAVGDENAKPSNKVQQAAAATRAAKAKFHEAQAAAAAAAEASAKAKAKAEAAAAAASEAEARADLLARSRPPSSLGELSADVTTEKDANIITSAIPPSMDWKARGQELLKCIRAYNVQAQPQEEHSPKQEECASMSSAAESEAQLTQKVMSKPSALWILLGLTVCAVSAAAARISAQPVTAPPQASCHWSWAAGCVASNEVTLSCRLGLPTVEDRDVCRGLIEAPRKRRIPKLSTGHLDRW